MMTISPAPRAGVPMAIRFAAAMVLLAAPLPAQQASGAPPTAAGDTTDVVVSRVGLVASASDIASDVGAAILGRGGNAVDAAVATAFALAVTYPTAGNLGGGGFMVVKPRRGPAIAIDYRERAPLRSTRRMYLDSTGSIVRDLTNEGYLAAGVPGTVRGLELAHRRYGRLRWLDVVMPAAELAARGFPVSPSLAADLNDELAGRMSRYPSTVAAYGRPGGPEWSAGDTMRLPDLARTLRAIATRGPAVFYTGWIADSLVADMRRNGGIISHRDLAAYRAKVRTPVRGRFRGYEIISMPPPSSGGVALIEMLNVLERFDLAARDRYAPTTLHLMAEAARRAYLDRARYLGDPDFVAVPVARLTSKAYAARIGADIDTARATSSVALGKDIVTGTAAESEQTTHFSVIDKDGMAVANTYTLEWGYGSAVVARGTGFLLNNEMGDFNKRPGWTTTSGDIGTRANLIAPGKRMLSSMTPTIVARNGRAILVTGSPGGRTIINTVLDVVLNVTAFEMDVRDAVDAPRLHHQWLPDVVALERHTPGADSVATRLRAMGHAVRLSGGQGDAHSIWIDPATGDAYGANDRRSPDSKVSFPAVPVAGATHPPAAGTRAVRGRGND
ncbi:MAG: gamma-glutamyltransferase [Gemmatimonadota bacterium]|nr:gamma-glutamyltransferase [Gemmatimonadota bacterium]